MSLPLGMSIGLFSTLATTACVADRAPPDLGGTEQASQVIVVDPRRSLAVTEVEILEGFKFDRVLDQLVEQSEVPGLTSLALFQQWWDTQNPPGCTGTLNGYPYQCRPAPMEGAQATVDPFANPLTSPHAYLP